MRKTFIFLTILLQSLVLGYMAGEREHILRNGKIIYPRTAQIDPRDLFRGDYVRLHYEISSIPAHNLPQGDSATLDWSEQFRLIYRPPMKPPAAIWQTANTSGMGICLPEHFMEEAELTDTINF